MPKSIKNKFVDFLKGFGYEHPIVTENGTFRYEVVFSKEENSTSNAFVDFFYTSDASNLYKIQEIVWNKNEVTSFILVTDNQTIIVNGKVKPNKDKPNYAKISSFKYGLQEQVDDYPEILRKEKLDGGYFFEFVIEKRKKNREQEVDKDLLLNLIALRQDMLQVFDDSHTIHLLILRCLFFKFLEDRGIYEEKYLVNVLETGKSENLIEVFNEVSKINGDIFKYDKLKEESIHQEHLKLLALFFQTDYRNRQHYLFFPYRFDCLPIQLISNVYEAFLNDAKKKGKGIYYTPKFVVDFMLSQTLVPLLKSNKEVSIFDPACGSGAFLVEGFKSIVKNKKVEKDFNAKINILKNQIFGIDIDAQALQIAAFSLYLALLEGLDTEFIKNQIKHQTPILPSLIGENLLQGNSIVDDSLFEGKTFDCIVANPPWGSITQPKSDKKNWSDADFENEKERLVIGGKGKEGTITLYKNVSDYQRSQAFLLRVNKWSNLSTISSMIVNNSVLLNESAKDFRSDFLSEFIVKTIFELSYINKIIFKKTNIGKVRGEKVEVGASEPSAILIFNKGFGLENSINYISPKLTNLSKNLRLIHISSNDMKQVKQLDLKKEDILWRVFVNGNWKDYQLIKSKILSSEKKLISCSRGFEPKKNAQLLGEPYYRNIITSNDFTRYRIINDLKQFNWNQELRRRVNENQYVGNRILIAYRPKPNDGLRLRCIYTKNDIIFKNDILYLKIEGVENQRFLI